MLPLLLIGLVFALAGVGWTNVTATGEEWRPVDSADLALKAPIVEPGRRCGSHLWDVRVDDGGQNDLVLSHYVRIKIFTERGREKHSKIDIPFLNGTKIKDVAARTIKPDGSIVELAKEDIIEKMIVKVSGLKLRTKTFVFPGSSRARLSNTSGKRLSPTHPPITCVFSSSARFPFNQ